MYLNYLEFTVLLKSTSSNCIPCIRAAHFCIEPSDTLWVFERTLCLNQSTHWFVLLCPDMYWSEILVLIYNRYYVPVRTGTYEDICFCLFCPGVLDSRWWTQTQSPPESPSRPSWRAGRRALPPSGHDQGWRDPTRHPFKFYQVKHSCASFRAWGPQRPQRHVPSHPSRDGRLLADNGGRRPATRLCHRFCQAGLAMVKAQTE